jgi:hypothetical protein
MFLIVVQPVFHHPGEPLGRRDGRGRDPLAVGTVGMRVWLVMMIVFMLMKVIVVIMVVMMFVMMAMMSLVTTHGKLLLSTPVLRLTRQSAYVSFLSNKEGIHDTLSRD